MPYPVWFGHAAMGLGLGLLPLVRLSLRKARTAAFAERPCRLERGPTRAAACTRASGTASATPLRRGWTITTASAHKFSFQP